MSVLRTDESIRACLFFVIPSQVWEFGKIDPSMSRTSTAICWPSTIPKVCLAVESSSTGLILMYPVWAGVVKGGRCSVFMLLCFVSLPWPMTLAGSVLFNVRSDHREEVKVCVLGCRFSRITFCEHRNK